MGALEWPFFGVGGKVKLEMLLEPEPLPTKTAFKRADVGVAPEVLPEITAPFYQPAAEPAFAGAILHRNV